MKRFIAKIGLLVILSISIISSISCSRKKYYDKGFSISPETETTDDKEIDGISKDSLILKTRPGSVILTGFPEYRLTPVYKLNFDKKDEYYYTGNNDYYSNYSDLGQSEGNQWNYNFMPGLQAVYGFNLVNVSLKNVNSQTQLLLFEKPVLIKTLYVPSFTHDTLFNKPVKRSYYMVSAYDEDTNGDRLINLNDLRRFFVFDLDGGNKENLIPANYSVISSEYDCANDYMYVYAQLDENKNGQKDETEKVQVFWIDLKNPRNNGQQYE